MLGVSLPQESPRKEEKEGEKHFPVHREDASSKRDAPQAAWQGAPGKPIFKPKAFACQLLPQWIYKSVHKAASPHARNASSSAQPCPGTERLPCLCEHRQPGSPIQTPPAHGSRAHLRHPQDRWELGTLQLGQRTQPDAGSTQGLFWAGEQLFARTGGRGACT